MNVSLHIMLHNLEGMGLIDSEYIRKSLYKINKQIKKLHKTKLNSVHNKLS